MIPDVLNLTLFQGLAFPTFSLELKDGSEEASPPLDLTDYVVAASVKRNYSDAATLFDIDIAITDEVNGVVEVTFTQAMTTLLTPGVTYRWDVLLQPPGEEPYMLLNGKIAVAGVITPVPSP